MDAYLPPILVLCLAALVLWVRRRDVSMAPPSPEPLPRPDGSVAALVRAGRKIEAIKRYRVQHGVGLKQAKDAVEALDREGLEPH